MGGVLDLFSGANIGQTLAGVSQMAARPTFELRFSQLQNTLIDRVNKKVEELSKTAGPSVDATKLLERARLQRASETLNTYQQAASNQYNGVADIYNNLLDMDAAEAATDPDAFNNLLGQINQTASLLPMADGSAAGIFSIDGVDNLTALGPLQVTRNGEQVQVTSYSDFTDVAEAQAAVTDALARVAASLNVINTNVDAVSGLRESVDKRLGSVSMEIELQKTEATAERAKQITKLEGEYAQMLNTLSVSFEGSQSITDRLKGLLQPSQYDKGSVMNLFT